MTTTTTRAQTSEETILPRHLRDYLLRHRDLAQDFTGVGAAALATLITLASLWETRYRLPAPPAERLERRALLAAVAEREAVEDVLDELVERTRGTRAAGRYTRARDALAVGATWAETADGVLFITRGNGDHWVAPLEGCDCLGSGDGWRCWASALFEAVEIAQARASERRPRLAA